MSKLNGAGPNEQGSRTGRGMGNCEGGVGRAYGCRRGYALGSRRFISDKNELASLEYQEKALEEELIVIREEKKALQAQEK